MTQKNKLTRLKLNMLINKTAQLVETAYALNESVERFTRVTCVDQRRLQDEARELNHELIGYSVEEDG